MLRTMTWSMSALWPKDSCFCLWVCEFYERTEHGNFADHPGDMRTENLSKQLQHNRDVGRPENSLVRAGHRYSSIVIFSKDKKNKNWCAGVKAAIVVSLKDECAHLESRGSGRPNRPLVALTETNVPKGQEETKPCRFMLLVFKPCDVVPTWSPGVPLGPGKPLVPCFPCLKQWAWSFTWSLLRDNNIWSLMTPPPCSPWVLPGRFFQGGRCHLGNPADTPDKGQQRHRHIQ